MIPMIPIRTILGWRREASHSCPAPTLLRDSVSTCPRALTTAKKMPWNALLTRIAFVHFARHRCCPCMYHSFAFKGLGGAVASLLMTTSSLWFCALSPLPKKMT